MQRNFDGYDFDFICEIAPEKNENTGKIVVYMPQCQYKKRATTSLTPYGAGPFCRFRIPKNLAKEGVYILTVDDTPLYVGECVNLSKRYNAGYGQISPRNCYVGGQPTNCRLNNLIYTRTSADEEVQLWFHETQDRMTLEAHLIHTLNTRSHWNRKG